MPLKQHASYLAPTRAEMKTESRNSDLVACAAKGRRQPLPLRSCRRRRPALRKLRSHRKPTAAELGQASQPLQAVPDATLEAAPEVPDTALDMPLQTSPATESLASGHVQAAKPICFAPSPFSFFLVPKGPCNQTVYTLALKQSLYRYFGAKVYTIWVHGPLGCGKAEVCTDFGKPERGQGWRLVWCVLGFRVQFCCRLAHLRVFSGFRVCSVEAATQP